MEVKSVMGIPSFSFDVLPNLNYRDQTFSDMGLILNDKLCLPSKKKPIQNPTLIHPFLIPLHPIPFPKSCSATFQTPLDDPMAMHEPLSSFLDIPSQNPTLGYGYHELSLHPQMYLRKEMGSCGEMVARGGNSVEKQRRGQMSEKFNELRSLIPNTTKKDRASIIANVAEYIKEMLRIVEELKTLVNDPNKLS